jgi:hypothetical protein
MRKVVCFSGGHSSALAAIETVRKYGKENVILLNHDISSEVEHQDIKRFKHEVADYLDIPITHANMENFEELTPLRVCKKKGIFGTQPGQTICTYYLKTKPFHDWLKANFPADIDHINKDVDIVYGFDAFERDRIQRRSGIMATKGYKCEFPLMSNKRTILNTEEVGIKRPSTYRIFKHANCIGCLKAGQQHWYVVYCLRPDIFQEAMETEKEIGQSIIKDVFLDELIPKFEETKRKNICPNDIENSASFWARVEREIPGQITMFPCDCAVL